MNFSVERFSAVEIFGVPLDASFNDAEDARGLKRLMGNYGLEAQPITENLLDITPYYWAKPNFRWLLSAVSNGGAVLELLPAVEGAMTLEGLRLPGAIVMAKTYMRTIRLPEDQEMAIIGGPSPRYTDQICIHELLLVDRGNK